MNLIKTKYDDLLKQNELFSTNNHEVDKKITYLKELKNFKDLFSKSKLSKYLKQINIEEITNYNELFHFISKINIAFFVKKDIKNDEYFECMFYENNYAWIKKGKDGIYRYFTKNTRRKVKSYTLIELFQVYYNKNTFRTVDKIVNDFNLPFMENIWIQNEYNKYNYNLTIIHSIVKRDHPLLNKYIIPHLKILETMNVLGSINIKKKEFSYDDESIFFTSNTYLERFLNGVSRSKITKILNYFALLGLINKVKPENIPGRLYHQSQSYLNKNQNLKAINFYTIPTMQKSLNRLIQKLEELDNLGVNYSSLSISKTYLYFGKDVAENIYIQDEIEEDKIKDIKSKIGKITSKINKYLKENNIAFKSDIINYFKDKDISRYFIDKYWGYIIYKNNFIYQKNNKKLKKITGCNKDGYLILNKNFLKTS